MKEQRKFTNLQCLNLFTEIRHPHHHLLSLLHPLSQPFDLLLHTYHPRLTIMEPISLGYNINKNQTLFDNGTHQR